MPRLAVIGGHSILDVAWPADARRRSVAGPDGEVTVLDLGSHVVLQRHGFDTYTPAHLVDHSRNLSALAASGCERVLAVSSVGSLRPELPVGAFVAPHDFIALDQPPRSGFDDQRAHVVPAFTPQLRSDLVAVWERLADVPMVVGGVYWQSNGPRFETPAEIRLMAQFADVVGMTVGSECVAACELDLEYAVVCVVDNLANGVSAQRLTMAEFEAGKAANQAQLLAALAVIVPELAT
jgi:5'-methylthioadenosine phosphorylase